MKSELARRQTLTEAVVAFLKANPGCWIPAVEFEAVGGRQAWRTRLSEARQILEAEGGAVENRCRHEHGVVRSEYRFLPEAPLGRSAEARVDGLLFDLHQRNG